MPHQAGGRQAGLPGHWPFDCVFESFQPLVSPRSLWPRVVAEAKSALDVNVVIAQSREKLGKVTALEDALAKPDAASA